MTTETQAQATDDVVDIGLLPEEQAAIDNEESAIVGDELSAEERASLTKEEIEAIEAEDESSELSPEEIEAAAAAGAQAAELTPEQIAAATAQAVVVDAIDNSDLPEVDTSALIEIAERIGINTAELTTISAALDKLAEDYDAGDIAQGAYDRQKRKLESQEQQIQSMINADNQAQNDIVSKDTQRSDTLSARYNKQFDAYAEIFLAKEENSLFKTDPTAMLKLQETINRMGENGMSDGLTPQQAIDAARAHLSISLQLPPPVVSSQNKKSGNERKTPIEVPPSIANMPAVMGNGIEIGEFAHLDKLSGLALETAISKMPESQRERWLNG